MHDETERRITNALIADEDQRAERTGPAAGAQVEAPTLAALLALAAGDQTDVCHGAEQEETPVRDAAPAAPVKSYPCRPRVRRVYSALIWFGLSVPYIATGFLPREASGADRIVLLLTGSFGLWMYLFGMSGRSNTRIQLTSRRLLYFTKGLFTKPVSVRLSHIQRFGVGRSHRGRRSRVRLLLAVRGGKKIRVHLDPILGAERLITELTEALGMEPVPLNIRRRDADF